MNFTFVGAARKSFSKLTAFPAFTSLKSSPIIKRLKMWLRSLPWLPQGRNGFYRLQYWGITFCGSLIWWNCVKLHWVQLAVVALHVMLIARYVWHISTMRALEKEEARLKKELSSTLNSDLRTFVSPHRHDEAVACTLAYLKNTLEKGALPSNFPLN